MYIMRVVTGEHQLETFTAVCLLFDQVKDSNRVSGNAATTCPFYDKIYAILGTRAASTPAGLLNSSTAADVVPPSEDGMAPGSPEASLEGNPAETSNSATTHTIADDSANSSTAITSNTSSGSTAATTTTNTTTTSRSTSGKEVRGMLQEDLLVLKEH